MENNNPPASWSALKDALQSLPAKNIQTAIDVLLTYKQPSADTYRFLTRAVELAQKTLSQVEIEPSMKILILDDDMLRHYQFKQNFIGHAITDVQTVEAAIRYLKTEKFDAAFLDHDLGGHSMVDSFGEEPTGYTLAKWMAENPDRKPERIYIHSYNPVGAKNMQDLLPGSILAPGLWMVKQ